MEAVIAKLRQCGGYDQFTDVVSSSFRPLVVRVLHAPPAVMADFRRRHADPFDDVRLLLLEALRDEVCRAQDPDRDPEPPSKRTKGAAAVPPDFTTPQMQTRLIDLLSGLTLPDHPQRVTLACPNLAQFHREWQQCVRGEGRKRLKAEGNDVAKFFTVKAYRRAFTRAWTAALGLPLAPDLKLAVLRALPDGVLPLVSGAWGFSDFLANAFDLGGVYALYALKGLFILMTKHNIDYPNLYTKLYTLFTADMLHSKNRSRFLELLGLLLTSTRLPAFLVASFIKKACRLALVAPTPTISFLVVIVSNLLRSHPEAMRLIHRTKSLDFHPAAGHEPEALSMLHRLYEGLDPFDANESDPQKTNAMYSSCWELKLLQVHYHPGVAAEANALQRELKAGKRDWKTQSGKSYLKLFVKELQRWAPEQRPVACTYHSATGLFDPAGHATAAWREVWHLD